MSNNAKVAGVLNIVSGVIGILTVLGIVLVILVVRVAFNEIFPFIDTTLPPDVLANMVTIFYTVGGVLLALASVLAIAGGVFALQKKYWGLALAGAIAGIFTFFPCGVAATIFTAMARPEFAAGKLPYTVVP